MQDAIALRLRDEAIRLAGPEVRRFCNGMFTNDARSLAAGRSQRSAMCDAKGRLLGLMQLTCIDEHTFLAILEGMTADAWVERYEKYVILDDVTVDVHRGPIATVVGADSARVLEAAGLGVQSDFADGPVVRVRTNRAGPGFDLLGDAAAIDEALERIVAAGASPGTDEQLLARRVIAGRIRFPEDSPGRFLVHELGLRDEVCHFEKGCYVGQEIIHRIDVMGDLKRRLVRVRLDGPADAGAELVREGQPIGKLTSPVNAGPQGWVGFSVVRKPADAPGTEFSVGSTRGRVA